METKHSPKPWKAQNSIIGVYIIDANGEDVASLTTGSRVTPRRKGELDANAKLLEAAPEMLEMLQRLSRTEGYTGPISRFIERLTR